MESYTGATGCHSLKEQGHNDVWLHTGVTMKKSRPPAASKIVLSEQPSTCVVGSESAHERNAAHRTDLLR